MRGEERRGMPCSYEPVEKSKERNLFCMCRFALNEMALLLRERR